MDRIGERTETLNEKLGKLALIAGAGFAAATAEIGVAVHAYATQEDATNRLSQAFITQGIYSKQLVEDYRAQADAIQNKTGVDNEAIVAGQTLLQGFLGQTKITKELTQAVVDFATAQKIDLHSAFEIVGKSVSSPLNELSRYGIQINTASTSQQKLAEITKKMSTLFGGQAEAAAQGVNSYKVLSAAFVDLQKAIGEKFAPVVTVAIRGMTALIQSASEHKEVVNFAAAILAATAAVTGATLAFAAAGKAMIAYRAIMGAAAVATNATRIAVTGLVGATGLGLLIIAATEVYLHWNKIWPVMQKVFHDFASGVTSIGGGLGKILSGIFHLNSGEMKEGLSEITAAFKKEYDDLAKTASDGNNRVIASDKDALSQRAALQKAAADKAAADRAAREQRSIAAQRAANAVLIAEANRESKATIALKKQEADTLTKIENEKFAKIRPQLLQHLHELQMLEANQNKIDTKQRQKFEKEILKNNLQFQQMTKQQKQIFLVQHQADLQAQLDTEETAYQKAALDRANLQIQSDNQYLQDQIKFGTAYAAINKAMHSEIYQGAKQAFSNLAELQQSSNATLKAIGKVAAIANIVIHTAESAMNIYAGFSTIPIIGPTLGLAAAAAAVAFGAEQVSKVQGANQGGVVDGVGPDKDSVLGFLTPGELVVPRKNFDETINAVANQRAGISNAGGSAANGAAAAVLVEIRDQLKAINSKFSAPTIIQGDVMADKVFVDALVRKITDAVRFRNANLVATRVAA